MVGSYGASIAQTTVDNRTVAVASYALTDGGALDIDGVVDGNIVDPVGFTVAASGGTSGGGTGSVVVSGGQARHKP